MANQEFNRAGVENAVNKVLQAPDPQALGATVAALIVANNPAYAPLAGLITAAINAILLGVPVQVVTPNSDPTPTTPQTTGGLLGWFRRILTGV